MMEPWEELLDVLQQRVGAGQVTTFGNCSAWKYQGRRNCGPAVVEMLEAAARRGHQLWTNRVVSDDGLLGAAVEAYGQVAVHGRKPRSRTGEELLHWADRVVPLRVDSVRS